MLGYTDGGVPRRLSLVNPLRFNISTEDLMSEDLKAIADRLSCPLYTSKDNLEDGFEYAYAVIERFSSGNDKAFAYAALHVLLNTISFEIKNTLEVPINS